MYYTSRPPSEAIAWQEELRGRLFRLLRLDDLLDADIPCDPVTSDTRPGAGHVRTELELNATPGRRFRAVLALPEGADGPVPAVVCIHGHGGNRGIVYDPDSIYKGFATALAESGYATLSTDVGQHEVYEDGRLLMGERLWDLRRCVDYLVSLRQVDAARLGCAGLSLGGEMAMWLGAMDVRIAATVSAGFLTFMDQMEHNHCMCWKFDGLREAADYPDLYSLMAPRPLLCQNGLQEGPTQFYVPLARRAMEEVQVIYRDLGCPERAALDVHDGGHEVHLPALLDFFRDHLGIAAP